ncbi:hypothetical protein FVEN_g3928 [Fusarium venenatum]|uniref:Uncharacterized protein n=2 Tax=Fusarium venenatum TaxID=56646 RepID=A0A2L2U1T2_9HYPO|nr:uncharacterized protein FVRRES_09407 [Fusarium venenatum]KAG8358186.1 hypothetical protein FVEN_g3928 [Fusarium venenatum]CEI69330.1 unnamed protein product [Fusarium venenatum]
MFITPRVWRDVDVEEFKKANRICFVTLDDMEKELADLATHLFNGIKVDAWWFDTSKIGPEYWNPESDMDLAQMRQLELETAGNNSSDSKTSEEAIDDETDDDETIDDEISADEATGPGKLVSTKDSNNQETETESEDAQQEKQSKRARKKKGKKRNKGTRFDKGFTKNKKKKRK